MAAPPPGRRTLSSWKEIASYFGVSARTSQKWESGRGLPVHRLPGGGRGAVFAEVDELEAWRRSSGGAAEGEARGGWRLWPVLTVILVLAVAVAAWFAWDRRGEPTAVRVEGRAVVVIDAEGRELWRRAFPNLYSQVYESAPSGNPRLFQLSDLDGDGHIELLFIYWAEDANGRGTTLYCYSDKGHEKWRFVPGRAVSTRSEHFSPVYLSRSLVLARPGEGKSPVVVLTSGHAFYYPNQVAVLSGKGELLREYWHSGVFFQLEAADLDGDGVDELYLGGVNNARRMATLVVLDPNELDGASREEVPGYQLQGFRPGNERARVLFPRSCIARSAREWNYVEGLYVRPETIAVVTREGSDADRPGGLIVYHLDRDLKLQQLVFSDGFKELHREMHAQGRLNHDFREAEAEPLKSGVRILTSASPR